MKLIMPVQPVPGVTTEVFLGEKEVFDVVKKYFSDPMFTAEQLQGWMGKNCSWGLQKEDKQVAKEEEGGPSMWSKKN